VILILALFVALTPGQNLVVSGTGSFSGSGVLNVRGDIRTGAASGAVSIPGTVNMNGTTAIQRLGGATGTPQPLTFATLQAAGSIAKQMDVSVTVSDALAVTTVNIDLDTHSLTLGGTSALVTGGSLDVSDVGCSVLYNRNTDSQTMLGLNYQGAVTLSGNATKDLAADASVTGAFSHSGGNLTVNHNLTVSNATPAFAAIADVTGNSILALSGTGLKAIDAINGIAVGSAISNTGVSGPLTVQTLAGNLGAINGGAGGVTFVNAATNGGDINGGGGAVTFSNTLAQSAGTITAGAGGVVFNGIPTISAGTVTAGDGANLDFNTNIANSGTISLTGTGAATINGDFTSVGTLSFAATSQVTFDGAGQTIPTATFGNVTMAGSAGKTAAASATLAGNLVLNQNLDMLTNGGTLVFSNSGTVTGAAEVIGAVQRTHQLAGGTAYAFNRAEVTMQFAANEDNDVTIDMRPGATPTGVGANHIDRYYGVSSAANLATNNANIQLYYLDGERVGSLNEAKYGLNKYDGALSKLGSNGGAYTRVDGAPANIIALSNVNQGLVGITQFAITPIGYITIADGNWNVFGTWGSTTDDIPDATDDAEVRHTVGMGGGLRTIANLTITDDATYTGILNVNDANFNATGNLVSDGAINVTASYTLTVGGTLTNNVAASSVIVSGIASLVRTDNNGTFTVANGGVANLTGAFNNYVGSSLSTVGTGALTITGADLTNAGSISNAGTITVQE
jgi:hypothetical protein